MAVKLGIQRGPQALSIYLVGLVGFYVGERLVGGESASRFIVSGSGLALVLAACLLYLRAWLGSTDASRRVERSACGLSALGLLAVGVYVLGSNLVLGPAPVVPSGQEGPGLRQVLAVLWPILLACAVLPLVFLQWSVASMGKGLGVDLGRAKASTAAAASLAVFLCTLFLVNAVVNEKDVHVDLRYFKTTSPSEASRELVMGMQQDVRALLFFPRANDVLVEVEPYFQALSEQSARFDVEQVDRAMEPDLAKQYRVSKEGAVVLVRGGAHEKIDIGDDFDRARRKLLKLDQQFQTAFLRLSYKREVVYQITGHGERGQSQVEGDQRAPVNALKRGIEASNYTVKRLDATTGLTQEVPDAAAALLWVGPTKPLFPGELEAVQAYLDRGGRLLLMLDPEGEHQPDALLEHIGLKFERSRLVHDVFLTASRTPADRYNIVTNKFSSHAAATTVSRHSRELPVALPTVGSLERAASAKKGNRVNFIVRSLPNTWADADGDLQRDAEEKRKQYQLAAAVSRKIDNRNKDGQRADLEKKDPHGTGEPEKKSTPKGEQAEMRVVVFADADAFADRFLRFRGNGYLLADALRWLIDENRVAGVATSEEDIPIRHTREEDVWWFYATVFAAPLLFLGVGVATRWGRGRKRR